MTISISLANDFDFDQQTSGNTAPQDYVCNVCEP